MTDLTYYFCFNMTQASVTGKSVSEALILESVTPNMTTDCSLIYNFLPRKIHIQNMLCTKIVLNAKINKTKNKFLYTTCSELVFFL